jgi:hypothetical protein
MNLWLHLHHQECPRSNASKKKYGRIIFTGTGMVDITVFPERGNPIAMSVHADDMVGIQYVGSQFPALLLGAFFLFYLSFYLIVVPICWVTKSKTLPGKNLGRVSPAS